MTQPAIRHILVAVDDSPSALAAARLAVGLALGCDATIRAVTVVADRGVGDRLRAELNGATGLATRRGAAADAVLRHVARVGAGVAVQTVRADGGPAECVLEQARLAGRPHRRRTIRPARQRTAVRRQPHRPGRTTLTGRSGRRWD